MALVKEFLADRNKAVRQQRDGDAKAGCGLDRHIIVGPAGSGQNELKYRSLIRFAHSGTVWDDVKRVVKVELQLRTETSSTHFEEGAKPTLTIQRLTKAGFSPGNNAENVWTADEFEWPISTTSGAVSFTLPINPATGKPQDEALVLADITALFKQYVPTHVLMPDGSKGLGGSNYGFVIKSPGDELANQYRGIAHSLHATTSANRPRLRLTYDPVDRAPDAPTLTAPGITGVPPGVSFEGSHNDPDLSPMTGRHVQVWLKGKVNIPAGSKPAWEMPAAQQPATSVETQTGVFSVPLSTVVPPLALQTDYEWRARTQDATGWGPFSAPRALRITSSAPSVVATDWVTVPQMATAKFGGKYSDPDNDQLTKFVIEMQAQSAHSDAAFTDSQQFVWTTGETLATADETAARLVSRLYGGKALGVGFYTYRIKVQDDTGSWSAWSYDDFQLTQPYSPDPSPVELITQVNRIAPTRIRLNKMHTDGKRGPGALIGYVDDPTDVGASDFMNAGGEMYFTLPALHPYCPEIEPHQTHYAVEQYYGDRYRTLFAGVITDFDADPETAVFYGTNYLGLLQTAVDERYSDVEKEANGSGGGGSKYTEKTIDFIIKDQLSYHKAQANSPVAFIPIATGSGFTALAERATIYSTYSEALPFISGLIDSHKQGTGRECRFYARPKDNTYLNWEWALLDNWGKDRPNIRLEYGGLLTDFRVVALGDFGTRLLAVGQKRGEVQVYRATGLSGLNEAQWGRRAKTRFYQDIKDKNDLQRRANEDASQLGKVGKRVALAIRADMLQPFDGWDIGDSIMVDIERGVVDSSQYGSGGYWTILGVEWRYSPDGHTDMTLTVVPKKSATPPSPDLIGSSNPGVPDQFQTGYGVPVTYGNPPVPTGGTTLMASRASGDEVTAFADELPLSTDPAIGAIYEDLNTGCTYQLDQRPYVPPFDPLDPDAVLTDNPTYGEYTLLACPPPVEIPLPPEDLDGPAQPTDIVTYPGMNTIGVRWSPISDEDYAYTEVQIREAYRAALPPDPGHVPPIVGYPERIVGPWASLQTAGSLIVIVSLQNTTELDPMTYDLRLRSVDMAGNTRDDLGSVKAIEEPERGWVDVDGTGFPIQESPTALPGNALVWDEAIIEDIFSESISADWIKAGTLHVGMGSGSADAIEVFNSDGEPIGSWSDEGIVLLNPDNPGYKMVLNETGMEVWAIPSTTPDGVPIKVTSVSHLGIDAASITFGSARGGHNLLLNSSFELGAFGVASVVSNLWDLAADWNAGRQGADVNITVGASSLSMATVV